MEQTPSIFSRTMNGLFSGLRTGLLMMGIFVLISAAVTSSGLLPALGLAAANTVAPSFTAAIMSVLPGAAIGVAATALFGAVNHALNTVRVIAPRYGPGSAQGKEALLVRSAEITQAPTVAMPIIMGHAAEKEHTQEHAAAPAPGQASWAERVGHGHKDRIAEIIANGSMSDTDRAAALQAERSQGTSEIGGRA